MSLVSAHGIAKSHGPHRVLEDVAVTIADGDRIGLVGDNGSGKTTLARILAGLSPPDLGEVMTRRGARVGYLAQVPELEPGATVLGAALSGLGAWHALSVEHAQISARLADEPDASDADRERLLERQAVLATDIERLGGWDREHRARAILQRLGVPYHDRSVDRLSGGERRRVALSALLVSAPDVLILDEPTNHLDTDSIDWLERYLSESYSGALVAITHDRYFLDRVATQTWEVSSGEVRRYAGGWSAYLEAKAEREAVEARTESNRRNFLRTELEWLRRQPKARGTKQKARTARAEAALDVQSERRGGLTLETVGLREGSEVLQLDEVCLDVGGRRLIDGLSLIVQPRQRLGIIGANGCGKTSLLSLVTGEREPSSGRIRLGKNATIAYFAQTRGDLDDARSVAENVAGRSQTVRLGERELSIYSYLERFSFRGEEINKKVAALSGGERARVALAKLLLAPANLLVLDEPTNDLDVSTLSALEAMLSDFAGSVLVVTHDRYFLDRVVTGIVAFEGEGSVTYTVGDYGNYVRLQREREREGSVAQPSSRAPEAGERRSESPRPQKLSYKEERELGGIEGAIDEVEADVARLERELADPELYRGDQARSVALTEQLERQRARAAELMDRWQELESKREAFEAARQGG